MKKKMRLLNWVECNGRQKIFRVILMMLIFLGLITVMQFILPILKNNSDTNIMTDYMA